MRKTTSIYNQLNNKKKAFTLIELLIVIAIIGILFVVLVSRVDFATDKAKATGVQTDFRSFQVAFEQVAKENAGFNTFGWDTGDNASKTLPADYTYTNKANDVADGIRNSYDEGDKNLNGKQDGDEVFTGRKIYTEDWTGVYTLVKPVAEGEATGTAYDADRIFALESAINANLDPKLHITISTNGIITMANGAQDPWKKEYHGHYLSNAVADKLDRGVIIIYSDGANGKNGSADGIASGLVNITTPGNNVDGKDDYALATVYTYANGYGEVASISKGFSNNQEFGDSKDVPVTPVGEIPVIQVPGGASPSYNHNAPELHPTGIDLDGAGRTIPKSGDTYKYDNYEYIYETFYFEPENNGWKVKITDTNQTTYGAILESINGKPVTSLYNTFNGCAKLITPPVIPTSVKNMDNTFINCTSLETAPAIPSSVTSMSCTFASCTSLITAPDMSNATSVTNMSSTFRGCTSLETAPVIPSSVTNLDRTFASCTSLITAPDMSNAISVTNMSQTFHQCKLLTTVPNLSSCIQLTNMYNTFAGCKSLTDLSSFVIPSSVTNMDGTFQNCSSLIAAPAIPSNVTNINRVFWNCTSLKGTIEINTNPTEYTGALYMDTQITGITGSTTMADNIMKTRTSTATNPTA